MVNLDFLKELRREGDRKYVAVLSDYFETELAVSRESLVTLKARLGIA
jgi:DNA-binding LytR/AlgR family response regulator